MTLSVNTNLASLAAHRALDGADAALATTVQRLSSGLRVNSARDDAAGLAIAERLTSRVRGAQQAARNANDGLSLFSTAEGALGTMADRLQRMRELLVQSMNGNNSASDRQSLDTEFQQQKAELDRVAAGTTFNGRALLDGSYGLAEFQIGADSSDGLDVALSTSVRADHLGAIATAISGDLRTLSDGSGGYPFAATYTTVPITTLDFSRPDIQFQAGSVRTTGTPGSDYSGGAAQISVDGTTVTLNANYGSLSGVAGAVQNQLDAAGGGYSVTQDGTRLSIAKTPSSSTATAAPSVQAISGAGAAALASVTSSPGVAGQTNSHAGFDVDGHAVRLVADHSGDVAGLVADIQHQLDASARGAYTVSGSSAGLSIQRKSGTDPPVLDSFTDTGAAVFAAAPKTGIKLVAGDLTVQVGGGPARAVIGNFLTPQSLADGVAAQAGEGVTASINDATGALEINAAATLTLAGKAALPSGTLAFKSLVNTPTGSLQDADALNTDDARKALLRVDAAIGSIDSQRGFFGAEQNRFTSVVGTQMANAEQASAQRGRIVDADIAQETAALSRQQVMQQAAQAIVAQANLMPRDVLALLR